MNILITNDDGINGKGLWALARELKELARVVVVAPDRERSACGTAVTLHRTFRVKQVQPQVPGVEAYAAEAMPGDCVILGMGSLVKDKVDLVISGINQGKNLGDDVLISGTVGAALQGYLHGSTAVAVSIDRESDLPHFTDAARFAALFIKRMMSEPIPSMFFNINLPDVPMEDVSGIMITRLAHKCHINTVEEGEDSTGKYYKLDRKRIGKTNEKRTDVWAIEHNQISITPLFANFYTKSPTTLLNRLTLDLLQDLKK